MIRRAARQQHGVFGLGVAIRGHLGDLHNMELDVEVVGGSGRVLPYLQSIDNGSGDAVVRTD